MDVVKKVAYLKLIITIVIWGSVYHVAKYLVSDTDIYTVAFVRFFLSNIVLLVMFYNKHNHFIIHRNTKHIILIFLTGAIGIFSYTTLFFYAESLISGNEVAILFAFAPCLTVLFGHFYLKQKVPTIAYLGIIVALCGAIAVVQHSERVCGIGSESGFNFFSRLSVGELMALGTPVCMAIYNVLTKKLTQYGEEPLSILTLANFFGTILLFITFWLYGGSFVNLLHKPVIFWVAMIYVSVIATAFCYKWYSDAIAQIGVAQSAIFLNGVPLTAVLIGISLGDTISFGVGISGLVIILGVIITNYSMNNYLKR